MVTIIFTADIHGNEIQYQKLTDYSARIRAGAVIIGGDILPKGFSAATYIGEQRSFLEKRFPLFMKQLRHEQPTTKVFLMMGNDDCMANLDILNWNDPELYQVIHGRRLQLADDLDI